MPIDFGQLSAIILLMALINGCASTGKPLLGKDDNWGEANRQTMAAQIIDPTPQYDYAVPEANGEHTAKAIERYRNDTVKRPQSTRTSNSIGGSSGSGSGSSGSGSSNR